MSFFENNPTLHIPQWTKGWWTCTITVLFNGYCSLVGLVETNVQ
jgi:hypothetical protein